MTVHYIEPLQIQPWSVLVGAFKGTFSQTNWNWIAGFQLEKEPFFPESNLQDGVSIQHWTELSLSRDE